ncbi:WD40 repeat-like protein [Fomitiporia mediterranea MF3/22]|uniref:WD40 repeat-like protein n=1 Tax=Fomitiporia mediterranea (strain MF3/22) TaxID=694068 RepID=UPI0004408F19|nr:WD40 repeat-like protein [Fomitiporia mediterranea MF3/22]EJC98188.1 WD40 repeat-like protein [Fomitiporia mediterranea MF3/22]
MDRGSAWSYVKAHLQCDIMHLVIGIAQGLAYLHAKGVVHSDIKSDNVLVSNTGDALLCDFGCARMMSATRSLVNFSSGIRGTSRYLACELLALSGQSTGHTKQTDIWAFGMAVFELLTRQRPFADLSDSQAIAAIARNELPVLPPVSEYWASRGKEVLQDLWDVCLDCWERNPADRPDMNSILQKLTRMKDARNPARKNADANPDLHVAEPEARRIDSSAAPIPHFPSAYRPVLVRSFVDDVLPEDAPSEQKTRSSGWSVVFNPRLKRTLNVYSECELKLEGPVSCVRFSTDGRLLATYCGNIIRIYETRTRKKICILFTGNMGSRNVSHAKALRFSPDSKYLALGMPGNAIKIWDIATKKVKHLFQGHQRQVTSVVFSGDGKSLVSGSADGTLRVWELDTGPKKVLHIKEPPEVDTRINDVAISPDGHLIAAGSVDSVVRIWETQSGNLVERLKGHRDAVSCVAFSADGKNLFSGSSDKAVKVWDIGALGTGPVRRLPLPPSCKPTGKRGGTNANLPSRPKRELPAPPVEKPPPGTIVGSDVMAELARERGERGSVNTLNFVGHNDSILYITESRDGQWFASGSKDHSVYLFEKSTMKAQFMLQGQRSTVLSADFSQTGELFATGCVDTYVRIWNYERIAT